MISHLSRDDDGPRSAADLDAEAKLKATLDDLESTRNELALARRKNAILQADLQRLRRRAW